MAITGTFAADFASFYTAVQQAEASLKSFESGAGKVETSLNRMVDNFSGRKLISDASLMAEAVERVGGTSNLTEKELARVSATVGEAAAKMRAMGIDIPPGLQKIATEIENMNPPASGLTTRMIALGSAVGSFIGNFASNLVQQGVSSLVSMGKEAFTSAGHILDLSTKTGLTTDAIQRMQFVADQTGGSLEQFTTAAFNLGARLAGGGASVQRAVADLGLSFSQLQALRPDQQFDVIAAALGKMDSETERNRVGVAIFGKSFSDIATSVGEGYDSIAAHATTAGREQLEALEKTGNAWAAFKRELNTGVTQALGELVIAIGGVNDQVDMYATGVDEYASDSQRLRTDITLTAEEIKKTTPVAESYVTQLAKAKEEVANLSTEQQKEIEAAKALGVSTEDLTAKFGLSEAALKLVSEKLAETETNTKKLKETTDAAAKSWANWMSEIANKRGMEQFADGEATMQRQIQNDEGERLMRIDEWQMKQAERVKAIEAEKAAEAELQRLLKDGVVTVGEVQHAYTAAGAAATLAAEAAATSWTQAMSAVSRGLGTMTGTVQAAQTPSQLARAAAAAGGTVAYDSYRNPYIYIPGVNAPGRAIGGSVTGGQSYVVGERGPELYTPGADGFVTPNGGAGLTNITIYVNGTAEDVARKVMAEITRTMKNNGRKWPAA